MPLVPELPPAHLFVRKVCIAAVPGASTPLVDQVLAGLQRAFTALGHHFGDTPDERTDAFLTSARLHEPVDWRTSPLFIGRRKWNLRHKPATYAVVQVTPAELRTMLERFEAALQKQPSEPADFAFPGLAPKAWEVLRDQGARGGPMMCVARLLQSQSKSLRVLMVVGDERVEAAYLFDLAGAYPRIDGAVPMRFFAETALRIATQLSTREATMHQVLGETVPRAQWQRSAAPAAMLRVSRELGQREFFTQMVRIADLVEVPALTDAIAQQYSEGCFGTWDPELAAQVVTITGSRQPVAKSCLTEDDLAVIAAVVGEGSGVAVRHVEGLRNDPPSTEAVEFESIDLRLPRITPHASFGVAGDAPVVRSKLHGHRGVAAYDPRSVEYVPMERTFHDYLVSCSTEAQANGIADAFSRAQCLRDPADPRTVAFTVLPGHGLLMVEKWVPGAVPFEVMLRAMDERRLVVCARVPQGRLGYLAVGERMELRLESGCGPEDLRSSRDGGAAAHV